MNIIAKCNSGNFIFGICHNESPNSIHNFKIVRPSFLIVKFQVSFNKPIADPPQFTMYVWLFILQKLSGVGKEIKWSVNFELLLKLFGRKQKRTPQNTTTTPQKKEMAWRNGSKAPPLFHYLDWRIILRVWVWVQMGLQNCSNLGSNYSFVWVPVQFGLRNLSKSRTLAFETKN